MSIRSVLPMLEKLTAYTTCDVADALVKNGLPNGGYVPHLVRQSTTKDGATTAGPAYTVEYAPLNDPRPAVTSHYMDSAPEGAVVVIGTAASTHLATAPYTSVTNALYGGLMSTRAKYLGCVGSVILGKVRDIDEHRGLAYPVFSYGLGIAPPNKAAKVVAVNGPLAIPGTDLVIQPKDIIVGDENGVAFFSPELLETVLRDIPPRAAADKLVAEDILKGIPVATAQKNRRS